jgi:hypothetical protein
MNSSQQLKFLKGVSLEKDFLTVQFVVISKES